MLNERTPIFYNRTGLNTASQVDSKPLGTLRGKLTAHMRQMLIQYLDASYIESVGIDPTHPQFTLLWVTFTSQNNSLWYTAQQIAEGLSNEEAVTLLELSILTNPESIPTRWRVKLAFDLTKYE